MKRADGVDLDAYGIEGRSPWRDVNWREHQRWVEVAGRRVNVVELGSGSPIVFVHGHSGAWQNWLEQLPVLAERHRVIAMDLPGFGRSPMPRDRVSIAGYGRILDELMGVLEIDAAAIVGNSMGGFVGAELAICFPERVERLVLVSAAGVARAYIGVPTWLQARVGAHALRAIAPLMVAPEGRASRMMRRPVTRRAGVALIAAHPDRLAPELIYELIFGSGPKPAAPEAAVDIARYDVRERLGEIACPTLVVWGARDRVVPPSSADEFERVIPDARKVVFDDTGHVPMLERPARFNALLEDFMAEEPNEEVDETSDAAA